MQTATAKENAQSYVNQNSILGIVALRRTAKVSVRLRKTTKGRGLGKAITYRIPMEVTQILKRLNGDCYPVCPRCKMTIEREYMCFCDRCGQKLGWSKLKDAVFVYSGYRFLTK